jgi:hypothetical protein
LDLRVRENLRIGFARTTTTSYAQAVVKELHSGNFGLLIAYVLPGITAVWGLSYVSETVEGWLAKAPESAPTVGGVLYARL